MCVCVLCKHDMYCSSRLNVNMHLFISLAPKHVQYSSINTNSEKKTQNIMHIYNT